METSELTLFSAMCESFCTAVEKARAEAMSLTDMYVQVKYDEQLFRYLMILKVYWCNR